MYSFLVFVLLVLSLNTYSASWATVTADKAIIFSDIEMKSKLGFVRKGKKLRVGDKPRNHGQVYPFVYQKRVVYIKKVDIQTSSELLLLQSAMERIQKKTVSKKSYQMISLGGSFGAYSFSSDDRAVNDKKSLVSSGFNLRGYSISPSKGKSLRLQMNYETGNIDKRSFILFNIDTFYHLEFFSYKKLSIDFFAGILLTPFVSYKESADFTKNGFGLGGAAGIELRYKLNKKWSMHLNSDIRYQYLSIALPDQVSTDRYNPSFVGLNTSFNMSYSYE